MTARCEHSGLAIDTCDEPCCRCAITQLPRGTCAERCCRADLTQYRPIPEVWIRATPAGAVKVTPEHGQDLTETDVVHALFHTVGGRTKRPDVLDMVRELCDPISHSERYTRTGEPPAVPQPARRKKGRKQKAGRKTQPRYHVSTSPALLVQLHQAITPKSSVGAGSPRPPASQAAARIEAIDTAARIELDAARWLRALGNDDMLGLLGCVRRLGSLLPSIERCHRRKSMRATGTSRVICCDAHRVEADLGRWWTWSRIVTGWDLPAWQPDNTCPLCGNRGTLRIRLVDQIATCVDDDCRETWDETTLGLLAEHIRTENHEDEEAS
ncbi:hypothetical protein [Kribbella sp. CA-293567]|uniref:hypothetical protein n=1 Tax=Kribbella sp. CA-293567 TaxID=3002436 RepID=UPI0022DCF701|nr:hypothetical protein [Kribbella sp. CA-293567]WBQ03000.1 hypothetical protein OX958_23820 [Kribbella sp. CA-293567]